MRQLTHEEIRKLAGPIVYIHNFPSSGLTPLSIELQEIGKSYRGFKFIRKDEDYYLLCVDKTCGYSSYTETGVYFSDTNNCLIVEENIDDAIRVYEIDASYILTLKLLSEVFEE